MAISRKETHYTKQEYNLALASAALTVGVPVVSAFEVDRFNWYSVLIGITLDTIVGGTDGTSVLNVSIETSDDQSTWVELDKDNYIFPTADILLEDATNDQNITISADLLTAGKFIRFVVDGTDFTSANVTASFTLGDGEYQPEGVSSIYRPEL